MKGEIATISTKHIVTKYEIKMELTEDELRTLVWALSAAISPDADTYLGGKEVHFVNKLLSDLER